MSTKRKSENSVVPEESDSMTDADTAAAKQRGPTSISILGGRGTGKSYLFQAMIQRTMGPSALSYYSTRPSRLHRISSEGEAAALNPAKFLSQYQSWERLPTTMVSTQGRYRLQLPFRAGLVGLSRPSLGVELPDYSGELLASALERQDLGQWNAMDSSVVVFCLPMWVAFPADFLSADDWRQRRFYVESFFEVLNNFRALRPIVKKRPQIVLALTMADLQTTALQTLRQRWIVDYMDDHKMISKSFRTGRGLMRYVHNARRVSDLLHQEFESATDPHVASIPGVLSFGRKPWIVPTSSIDGRVLDHIESEYADGRPRQLHGPSPVHVELPLLISLCQQTNAPM